MNDLDVRQLLIAGGVPQDHLVGPSPSNEMGNYCSLFDPGGAEALGQRLAEAVRPHQPTLVVTWEDLDNSVLAYIVARELGVNALRVVDASGVLDFDGAFGDADRAVLVSDAFRTDFAINAMRALTEQHGGHVVAFAALMSTPALSDATGDAAVTALWATPGDENPTS